jgi:hypothetical protein
MAVGLGLMHTFAAIQSQSMNADGISYLDIGDAYFHADWANAINAVWSPLYSWLLGFVNYIFKPPMAWQFPIVQLVNFCIYIATLGCFEFLWEKSQSTLEESGWVKIPDPLWWMLGYLLFTWTTLSLIQIWSVTPDLLMAAFLFLAAGILAQIRRGDEHPGSFLTLGLVLGLGYLSKTFMFSVAIVFLGLAWLIQKQMGTSPSKTLLAFGIFLLISLPFISLISKAKGRFTIGEAGTVTYLRHVVGIPYPHWQGDPHHNIVPAHPSRLISQSPAVYEFGEPIGGTYPISTDPSYWYEGIKIPFSAKNLFVPLLASGMYYLDLFIQKQGILFACVSMLYFMGQWKKLTFLEIVSRWALVIPAIIAFGLYAFVLVAGRYIGAFVILFWADILANVRIPDLPNSKKWIKVLGSFAAVGLLVNIVLFNLDGFTRLNPSLEVNLSEPPAPPAKPLAVARTLEKLEIKPGDKVGVIGYAYDSFWARLAGVKIVAEMSEADAVEFWNGNEILQQSVLRAFAGAGVKAVIAEYVPEYVRLTHWHQVGDSNYFIYVFSE